MIQWSSALSVGVREIDGQHQRLVALINDLDEAMRVGKGKQMLGKILSELAGYARVHFATEEGYFDRFSYPEAPEHRQEHQNFIEKVSRFKAEFDAGRLGLTIEIMSFLGDWLKGHIVGKDQRYSALFNAKGLV